MTTPHRTRFAPVSCRGRAPSRPTRPLFPANPRWFPNASPPRVGADLCVRPDTPFCGDLLTGRHTGRPLQILLQPSSTPGNRAGTEPRPYSRRMPNAGSRSTRHPHPRLPQTKTPGMTAGTKASLFRPPSPVPTSFVPESPVLFGMVSKGRAAALPLVVSRRVWEGNSKSLPESFLGSARGYSFDSKRISSRKPPTFVGGSPSTQGVALPRHAGSSCPTGCSCQGTPSAS